MKIKTLILTAIIAVMLTSCASNTFFQVYKVTPTDKIILKENNLVYEDNNCKILYNLWNDGGNIGFMFKNKTEKNIYLNMEESYFVLNGIAHNYYRNRVFTNSINKGISASHSATVSESMTGVNYINLIQSNRISAINSVDIMDASGYSVSYNEEKIICIPALTSKIVSEYSINKIPFRHCDLFQYPTNKKIKVVTFTKENSPLVFSNRITYTVGEKNEPIKLENEFYVTEIGNYPKSKIVDEKFDDYCGKKETNINSILIESFNNFSPDKFYIKYDIGQTKWIKL